MRSSNRGSRFGWLARAATLACAILLPGSLVVSASAATGEQSGPAVSGAPAAPIAAGVFANSRETADFWIRFDARADTASARTAKDRTARGQQVVGALQATASRSQAKVRTLLDAAGVSYSSFWVSNAIKVSGGSRDLAERIAALDGVTEIRPPQKYSIPKPIPATSTATTAAADDVEWGVANIRAPEVWSQFGTRGEGIVVANIDTGVQYQHPALVGSYRGNNGDGTFDHNYNWFNAAGVACGRTNPCDLNGHGTHTMGTMVGDGGEGNHVGVAPGVTWIAANGCCPSDEALLRSSEWMLAPTDLSGQNPDVSKRPHIINNSWSSELPTDDPFLEEIQQAWADSGIFGVWANGNNGPSCGTSGTPGSRALNYSVGAYDSTNTIASFSSRGPGQDGEIKPNISAPGQDVRSTWIGDGYNTISGTSMATPHVAGAIALLWAARPALSRDIEATRAALDLSAVDTPDDQCGGSAADNNVYGEGRLDALALVNAAAGGLGRLVGTVTDAEGRPVPNTPVVATGSVDRTVRTRTDGTYTLVLVPGEYTLTVSGVFGHEDAVATVQVSGDTTTHDIALVASPRVRIDGAVTDGSGHGWPLYAKVSAVDATGHSFVSFTDPATGRYTLPVVRNNTYTVRTEAVYRGYDPEQREIAVDTTDLTEDTALTVDLSCTAPGYRTTLSGVTETFDEKKLPRGWSVTNVDPHYPGYKASPGWLLTNPGRRANATGGQGNMAIVDSDHYGQHNVQDTALTTGTLDLSRSDEPAVVFATDLNPAVNSTATVDVSTDNGRTWETVWRNASYPGLRGPALPVVSLPQAAGKKSVKVRFHYTGQWSGWWQVDDVFIGNRACDAVDGGLVVGQVTDSATDAGLTGATVTSAADPTVTITAVGTPDDAALGDGVYWLFAPGSGEQGFTAAAAGHTSATNQTTVTANQVSTLDHALAPTG